MLKLPNNQQFSHNIIPLSTFIHTDMDLDNYFFNKQFNLPIMHSFTQEDLLQYLYKETSIEKTLAIWTALETDWSLREKLEVIISAQQRLEKLSLSPRKKVIDNILKYAEKSVKEFTTEV